MQSETHFDKYTAVHKMKHRGKLIVDVGRPLLFVF